MQQARALYRVQQIELEIIEHSKRVKTINALLEDDAQLKKASAAFDIAEANLRNCGSRVKAMEEQIESVAEKRKSAETQLYSGKVSNPKALQDLQMEVEYLTRRRDLLDEQLLELMIERDEAQQQRDDSQARLEESSAQMKSQQESLRKEKTALTDEINALMVKRKTAFSEADAPSQKLYSSLRKAKANRPVSILKGKTCATCGIEQNNSVINAINRREQLALCGSCGRILLKS